jgi:hypothetical protein
MRVEEAIEIAVWSGAGGPGPAEADRRLGHVRVVRAGGPPVPWVERLATFEHPGVFGIRLPVPGDPAGLLRLPSPVLGAVVVRRSLDPRRREGARAWTALPGSGDLMVVEEHEVGELMAAAALPEANRTLRDEMRTAAESLSRLDVAGGREVLESLAGARRPPELPAGADARAVRLLDESLRVLVAMDVVRSGRAGPRPLSASGTRVVGDALNGVARAARRGVEAGVEHALGRPIP